MNVFEEYVCVLCGAIYESAAPLRDPKNRIVCGECYDEAQYILIDDALRMITRREKISLKKLANRLQVLIINEE